MSTSRPCTVTVTDETDTANPQIIARFVYGDDATAYARFSASREPHRVLRVEDKAGIYNDLFGTHKDPNAPEEDDDIVVVRLH